MTMKPTMQELRASVEQDQLPVTKPKIPTKPTTQVASTVPAPGRTSLLNWLVTLTVIGVLCLVAKSGVAARTEHLGSAAFPDWMWRIYDHKVWPLTLLPRGAKR